MALFDEAVAAQLAGATVKCLFLVEINLTDAPVRLHTSAGTLTADGQDWMGAGNVASISGIEQAIGGTAPEAKFGFSGVDPQLLTAFRDQFDEQAKGRRIRVALQMLQDEGFKAALGGPVWIFTGIMSQPSIAINEDGPRDISVSAESIFVARSQAPFSLITDRDQQARFAGDLGAQFIPSLVNKTVTWPDY